MRRPRFSPVLSIAVAAGALALSACSESVTSPPTRGVAPSAPSRSVTSGTNSVTLASDGSTQFCSAGTVLGDYSVPASYAPLTGCGTALDLMSALGVYNPGWDAPISGSDWIGFTANGGPSSDYRAETGRYVFQETFDIPAGATAPSLNLGTMSDNAVAVYLNGTQVAAQTIQDCNSGTCNWQQVFNANTTSDFVIGGSNTVTVLLINTPIGYPLLDAPLGGPAPNYGCWRDPQDFGEAGFATPFDVPTSPDHVYDGRTKTIDPTTHIGCQNPTALDFQGTVTWTPAPPPSTTWCSPGYWKNHPQSWPAGTLTLLYNDYSDLYAHGPYTFADNPTLYQVISHPSTYKGPATNNVADLLSLWVFGTPIGSGIESCPLN